MSLEDKLRKKAEELSGVPSKVSEHFVLEGRRQVDHDIVVEPGATLEIRAGTELYFGPEAGIISYGRLVVEGNEKDRVIFTAKDQNERWRNITIVGGSSDDSKLSYFKLNNGSGRNEIKSFGVVNSVRTDETWGGGIWLYLSNAELNNFDIYNCKSQWGGGAIRMNDSNSSISYFKIWGNHSEITGGGIDIDGNVFPEIHDGHINSNVSSSGGGIGIWPNHWEKYQIKILLSSPSIERVDIKSNRASIGGGVCFVHGASPYIADCRIENNTPDNIGFIRHGE